MFYRKTKEERVKGAPVFIGIGIVGALLFSSPTFMDQASSWWLLCWIFPLIMVIQFIRDKATLSTGPRSK